MRIALDLVIRVFRREQWFVFFIDSRLYLFDFNSKLTTHSADTLLLMLAAMLVTIDGAIATVSSLTCLICNAVDLVHRLCVIHAFAMSTGGDDCLPAVHARGQRQGGGPARAVWGRSPQVHCHGEGVSAVGRQGGRSQK